jgi:hypothetical protein
MHAIGRDVQNAPSARHPATWPPWWPSLRRPNMLVGAGGHQLRLRPAVDATELRLIAGAMAGG